MTTPTLSNRQIADLFEGLADLLSLKGEIIHRIMAYRRVAQTIHELPRDLRAVAAEGKLKEIEGVGEVLESKILEMLETGRLRAFDELAAEIPAGLIEVLRVNGVGPKKAMLFHKELGVTSVESLKAAGEAGKLAKLAGMGAKSEKKILEGIASLAVGSERVRLDVALIAAERLMSGLRELPGVQQIDIAGSIRRGRATIGDIDLLIAAEPPYVEAIMQAFVGTPEVQRILGQGPTKSSIELLNGRQCDLRVIPPERYGTALAYFTGSQLHNIKMRELALARGLSLNEWAFTPTNGGAEILCPTEADVFRVLELPYIPPELREDRGEIEAAQAGKLPRLIEQGDILGDLHMHTTWSDGKLSVREMAETARAHGLKHIVITDHSVSLGVANGLSVERLRAQREEIRRVDAEMGGTIRVFQGVELEILSDGRLDHPDEVLAELDMVVASLHTGLRQERAQVTERLLNAIRNPHVDIIGHPRGQMILSREGADLDMDAVFAAAKEHGTVLEINANPYRLDLDDAHARRAVELGVMLSIDTDAHSGGEFDVLRYGIMTARRGWVQPENVINTWSTEQFAKWIEG